MKRSVVAAVWLVGGIAAAGPDPVLAKIDKQLPPGWTMLATDTELVFRHDRPCYGTAPDANGVITLELRYRLEPTWTAKQLADAADHNAKLDSELAALHARYVDDAAFSQAAAPIQARLTALPVCNVGRHSVFDAGAAKAARQKVDPADAGAAARRIEARMLAPRPSPTSPPGECWTGAVAP